MHAMTFNSAAVYNRRGQRRSASLSSNVTKRASATAEYPTIDSETRYATLADCQCRIELDENYAEILTNFDTIRGIVHFYLKRRPSNVDHPMEFKSLRIQLEGIATTKFCSGSSEESLNESQSNSTSNGPSQTQEDRFLPLEEAKETFLSSLCFHFIKGSEPAQPQFQSHGGHLHSFPFEIFLTGQTLPATFKTEFGKIDYLLVVYGCLVGDVECVAADKFLTSKGCFNLSQDEALSKSFWVGVTRRAKPRSFFSKKCRQKLRMNLNLERRGFLPGETLRWELEVQNPAGEHIRKFSVSLVQKIIYFANWRTKTKSTILEHKEQHFDQLRDAEVHIDGSLVIPLGLMPSFSRKTKVCVEILYLIQFTLEVDLADQTTCQLRGETLVVIGTARDDDDHTNESTMTFRGGPMHRMASDWDTMSIQTCSTLPPSYSNLTSRRASMETLPPSYAELSVEEDEEDDELERIINQKFQQSESLRTAPPQVILEATE